MLNYEQLYFKEKERVSHLQIMLDQYQHDNWNLNNIINEKDLKILQADKQIDSCIEDLKLCKERIIKLSNENEILNNRIKTLMACMPKENQEIISNGEVLNGSSK